MYVAVCVRACVTPGVDESVTSGLIRLRNELPDRISLLTKPGWLDGWMDGGTEGGMDYASLWHQPSRKSQDPLSLCTLHYGTAGGQISSLALLSSPLFGKYTSFFLRMPGADRCAVYMHSNDQPY